MYLSPQFLLTLLFCTHLISAQNTTIRCVPGLKMFVSRGTGELTPLGETESLVRAIASQINESSYEAINYPASLLDPMYFFSVGNGTALLKEAVEGYAQACPESKMAFFGYSQGAQITSNIFCGMPTIWSLFGGVQTNGTDVTPLVESAKPLPTNLTKNVVAVVLFGDPTHRSEAVYNHSNGSGNGIFYRGDISACNALGDRIRSYCAAGDPYCDVGGATTSPTVHLTYVIKYGAEVAEYVVEQYKTGMGSDNSSDVTAPSIPVSSAGSGAAALSSSFLAGIVAMLSVFGSL